MPELLAPVGGRKQLEAAINNGADAVYMGGSLFNARIKADNFTNEELQEAIDLAHERNVKIYITFNTLIKDSELGRAFDYACFLYEAGADAIIIQDMGLADLIHTYLPNFPMHLSTQGTVYNTHALELVRQLGFKRVVPARELSLDEIGMLCAKAHSLTVSEESEFAISSTGEAKKGTNERANEMEVNKSVAPETDGLQVEVFVHGALCMCYSGQCQMSRLLGAKSESKLKENKGNKNARQNDGATISVQRSGNRGLCAQPCRLPYTDDKGKTGYWLSPKDLCTIDILPQLIDAGVDSFKIEGRLKSPEYVATVTRIYRKYIDIYEGTKAAGKDLAELNNWTIAPEDIRDLTQIFNRGGFTHGYINGNPNRQLLSGDSPKNQGLYLGKVYGSPKAIKSKSRGNSKTLIDVKLDEKSRKTCDKFTGNSKNNIHMGDGVEIRTGQFRTGNVVTYIGELGNNIIRIGDFDKGIHEGDKVYKVTDKALNAKAISAPNKKVPITMKFTSQIGKKPVLEIRQLIGAYAKDETSSTNAKEGLAGSLGKGETVVSRGLGKPARPIKVMGDFVTEKARKKPITSERIAEQISKLGDTPFEAVRVEIEGDHEIMLPVSILNQMRREGVERLLASKHIRRFLPKEIQGKGNALPWEAVEPANESLKTGQEKNLEEEKKLIEGKQLISLNDFMKLPPEDRLATMPYILNVSRGNLDKYIEDNFDTIANATKETGIAIGNLGWIKQFIDAGIKVYGDYGLNAYNKQCISAFEKIGVRMFQMSHETIEPGKKDIKFRESRFNGRIPLMITEHPLETEYLIDRKGVKHKIIQLDDKYLVF